MPISHWLGEKECKDVFHFMMGVLSWGRYLLGMSVSRTHSHEVPNQIHSAT
jgi:hypothetical protein